jgi:hypothetical protein
MSAADSSLEDYHMDHTDNLRERIDALEDHARRIERRMRWWRGIACSVVMLGLSTWALPSGTAQTGNQDYATGLARRIQALEYKLQYVTGGVNEVVITGANLRIVNGLDATGTTNGLGNLIVGYNEPRDVLGPDVRTGSHNIVVGNLHNFSSFGGLVVGQFNEISEQFASVSGGVGNAATGSFSSISGGISNTASANGASVSGGLSNRAHSSLSWVGGGTQNTASANFASVSGGLGNRASGQASSVSGGHNRSAPEQFSWAAGALFFDDF